MTEAAAQSGAAQSGAAQSGAAQSGAAQDPGFDWSAAEAELGDLAPPPRFTPAAKPVAANDEAEDPEGVPAHDVERPALTLADVGGLLDVKERLQVSFLAPMRNPELRKIYGKSLRGGLLLYGPPGCGKTFIARAVAGEIGASFISVGISEVLELWFGASEKNLSELFELARRQTPCVLFFDELDALGQRRSQTRSSMMRTVVNQFLTELDSVGSDNEGVFVLGRRTLRGTWIRRYAVPAGSTGPCWSCRRMPRPVRRSCAITCATGRSPASIWTRWWSALTDSPAPTSPTCVKRPPRTR